MPRQDSPIFVIQEDGRFGAVRSDHTSTAFDESVTIGGFEASLHQPSLGVAVPHKRYLGATLLVVGIFLLLGGRSAYLQIIKGSAYRALAERNRVRETTIPAPRGSVVDRHGTVLASSQPTFVFSVRKDELPHSRTDALPADAAITLARREAILTHAAEFAGLTRADLDLLLASFPDSGEVDVPVKRDLSYEAAMRLAIALPEMPGFHLTTGSRRSYDASARSLSHVLGYTGAINAEEWQALRARGYRPTDDTGKTGLEKSVEALLRGTSGSVMTEVDSRGNETKLVSKSDPVPGSRLTLGLDLAFQRFAEEQLQAAMKKANASRGSIVAIDPHDGSVRALVSLPAYDNNQFVRGLDIASYRALADDPEHPLFPRAVSGTFPAGSTFKPFIAYTALKEGIVTEHTTFLSTGGIHVGIWFFPDWKAGGHGLTDVRKAIAWSVNTFFYIVGGGLDSVTGLGVERITDYAEKFGFGKKTGIDLPGEAEGFLPTKEWKERVKGERWFVGDTYHLAIGQGDLLVTPLQMAAATAIVANRGTPVRPHLVTAVDGKPVEPTPSELAPLDPTMLEIVRQGMRQTVTAGTAPSLNSLAYPVAGKTGTAQPGGDVPTHAWFVGFGPYTDPDLAIAVLIENGGEGSSAAVPVARELFRWWFANESRAAKP